MSILNVFSRMKKQAKARVEPTFDESEQVQEENLDEVENNFDLRSMFVKRSGKYTQAKHAKQYQSTDSFIDKLPYVEYLDGVKMVLLEDGRSVGAVYELSMIATEGRSKDFLADLRDQVCHALQDCFAEDDYSPWVAQFYCQDDEMASDYEKVLRSYVRPSARGSAFTEHWLEIMAKHLRDVSKSGGLFEDKAVTGVPWRGQQRRARLVVYRYVTEDTLFEQAVEELSAACESVENAMFASGINVERVDGRAFHEWLLRWFNPNPDLFDDKEAFYRACHYTQKSSGNPKDLYLVNDFSESLFVSPPETKEGFWHFDNMPHEVIVVDSIRRAPDVGHITGEISRGEKTNSLFDLFPENTVMVMTMVVYPQDMLEAHIKRISDGSLGDNTESRATRRDCDIVQEFLAQKNKMYRSSLAFYIRSDDQLSLRRKSRRLRSLLLSSGLVPVAENTEVAPLNSYLRWLPMNFNPVEDKKNLYTKFNFVQHITNLLPIFGRGIGTRHPGITYFNRGGAPLDFDPLNKDDRSKAAHSLILGPTGAGKSATLNGKIAQFTAMYRPRWFIIEAGNSFGLMGEYLERYGLTVNRITLKPGGGVSLPLFADCHKLIVDPHLSRMEMALSDEMNAQHQASDNSADDDDMEVVEGDEQRDILGEMEMAVRLMVTGGETKEDDRLTRPDKAMIRKAILSAAHKTYQENRTTITQDIRDAFYAMRSDPELSPEKQRRAEELGDSIGMFCEEGSFEAELFNREGEVWPDADVTLVDLATLARDGYESLLAIVYISLINHINSVGEKYQFSGRPIINLTDESHIITVNPLLARFLVKAGKMWRKLAIWLWMGTQNTKDYPNDAAKLLSMIEFWELLCLEKAEIGEVTRFKQLTPEQVQLILSVRKENRKYTEGVLLSSKLEMLFRVVPPSLYLALAMTEPEEKAERAEMMQAFQISELDAAIKVAEKIDKARGINL